MISDINNNCEENHKICYNHDLKHISKFLSFLSHNAIFCDMIVILIRQTVLINLIVLMWLIIIDIFHALYILQKLMKQKIINSL